MFYQTEAKPQGWRAVAVFDDRGDRLLYLGRSSTQVRAGFAEAIPLPDSSVAAVTVADAFHWFDPGLALSEIRRVLLPAGGLKILHRDTKELVLGQGCEFLL